jgi:A/G-specific adenine glycosylase
MMDLGATLCTRAAPDCRRCPLSDGCIALRQGNPKDYPAPKPRRSNPVRSARFLLVGDGEGRLLLERRPPSGIWGGLWVPPELGAGDEPEQWCLTRLGARAVRLEMLAPRRHSFTHFHLDIQPYAVLLAPESAAVADACDRAWVDPADPGAIGLPAPIRRLLSEVSSLHRPHDGDSE